MTRSLVIVVAVLLVTGAGAFFVARHRTPPPPLPSAAAVAQPARAAIDQKHVKEPDRFVGVILAHDSINVSAKIDGRVDQVHFRLGDSVKAGDILCNQDARSIRHELEIAEAALQAARADEERSGLELQQSAARLARRKALSGSAGAQAGVSGEELENAEFQKKLNDSRVVTTHAVAAEKRAQRDQLRQTLAEAEIRAPFDGHIAARFVDPGTLVTRGTPIVRLISDGGLWMRFAVPQEFSSLLVRGVKVEAQVDDLAVTLAGVVEKIAPEVDTASQMVFVEARVDGQDGKESILSGRVARVALASRR